jgi:uncharacterized membrane protein
VRLPRLAPKCFITRGQEAALVAAIRDAERGNRGEVRVHLERRCPGGNALHRARELFHKLGMPATRDDTGVLLYVAVEDRKAAVFAGAGIHGAAREGFWQQVVDAVAQGYRRGEPVGGLVEALGRIGTLLREHAPGEDMAGNELPDEVSES